METQLLTLWRSAQPTSSVLLESFSPLFDGHELGSFMSRKVRISRSQLRQNLPEQFRSNGRSINQSFTDIKWACGLEYQDLFLRDHDKQRHPRAFQTTTWNHSLATLVEQLVTNSRYVYQLPFIRSESFSWFHLEKCPWECEASLEEVQSRQQHLADCAWSWDDNGRAAPSHYSAINYSARADVIPKYHFGVVWKYKLIDLNWKDKMPRNH